jgi:amino acid adenylation domain-containing protein
LAKVDTGHNPLRDGSDNSTLIDLLQWRAAHEPDKPAYVYLPNGGPGEQTLTYAELDQHVRSWAASLQFFAKPGERALLAYSDGLDVVIAFWACLYAGVIAVPVPPPDLLRAGQSLPRLGSILRDAEADLILVSSDVRAAIFPLLTELGVKSADRLVDFRTAPPLSEIQQHPPQLSQQNVAYLQYTSGSTSDPKGVMVAHGNLMHHCRVLCQAGEVDGESRSLTWLPYFHDYGLVNGLIAPLYAGIPAYILSPLMFLRQPVKWLDAISRYRITHSGGPCFAYDYCVRRITESQKAALDLSVWAVASCGAEPIRAPVIDEFVKTFAVNGFKPTAFAPAYGLAEFTLLAALKEQACPPVIVNLQADALERGIVVPAGDNECPSRAVVGCGVPAGDTRIVIVNPETDRLCPPDHIGEIWLAGHSTSAGYWGKSEESHRIFQARLSDSGEGSFLRTGDLGFLQDGQLFVTGRLKDLIIIRGRNYYPQDIEFTVEKAHQALRVGGGAAFSIQGTSGEQLVVIQEVSPWANSLKLEEMAATVRRAVTDHHELHVTDVVLIKPGGLLKTSSGKVRRGACRTAYLAESLPILFRSRLEPASAEIPDARLTRAQLLALPEEERRQALGRYLQHTLAKLLRCDSTAIVSDQPLSSLGMDSLRAMSLKNLLEEDFGAVLTLSDLLQGPTVAALVRSVLGSSSAEESGMQPPPIVPIPRNRPLPLSYSQQRMWFMHQLTPDTAAYHIPIALQLDGPLNQPALEHAASAMIARHESFRTTFEMTAEGLVQRIGSPSAARWEMTDLRAWPVANRREEAIRLVTEQARRPFDLVNGPLFRYMLIRIEDEQHVLVLNLHHIIGDHWSFALIGQEFAQLYNDFCRGIISQPLPEGIQYADFAVWQRTWINEGAIGKQMEYWRKQLTGIQNVALPTDFTRPQAQRFAGSYRSVDMPDRLIAALSRLCAERHCTLFMILLAAFQLQLSRYAGMKDIAVGIPVANRLRLSTEAMIGTFVNTLVLRTDLSGDPTFLELLDRVRKTTLGAFDNQDVPFERLVDEFATKRELDRSPLIQVLFNVTNGPMGRPAFEGLSWSPFEFDGGGAQFDLTMSVDLEFTKKANLVFRTDLFTATTIERMISEYRALLEDLASDPRRNLSAYSLLGSAERRFLLEELNKTKTDYPDVTLLNLVSKQAERTPDAVAVSSEEGAITYQELEIRANRLARYLLRQGVGRESTVGICLERSLAMVVGLLGIMKAGAMYVPLDPDYPPDRLKYLVEDSGVRVCVTASPLLSRLPGESLAPVLMDRDWNRIDSEDPTAPEGPDPSQSAYVIYTSGSTGRPKGVQVQHDSLVNLLWSMKSLLGVTSNDVLLAVTTISFDIAGLEIYLPLMVGGRVELVGRESATDGRLLARRLQQCRPTIMQATPATWRMLIESGWETMPSLTALCGGEALPRELANRILDRAGTLWNVYGPTETTIWSTAAKIEKGDSEITIGRPLSNTELYILDDALQPVPMGMSGELYIGGAGVARGYWNRPELTAERFIPHPFTPVSGGRLYKTGDLVRYSQEGMVVHLGRLDHQVKIRGYRVEIGEVEQSLQTHSLVRQAIVSARSDNAGLQQLVAYIVPVDGQNLPVTELRAFLQTQLPEYMIPSTFVRLEEVPLTANGKINRSALPDPLPEAAVQHDHSSPPRTIVEVQLTALWQQVLETSDVGVTDNFFELGGHSLKAVQLFSLMEQTFGRQLPLATLFHAPTISQLANVLTSSEWIPPWRSLVAIQPKGKEPPIFGVPGIGGNVLIFSRLAKLLGTDQPFYGLQARGLDGKDDPFTSVPEMAAHYLREMRSIRPNGPYRILGTCTGGVVAYEMAQQLRACEEQVILMILESWHPLSYQNSASGMLRWVSPAIFWWNRMDRFLHASRQMSGSSRIRLGLSKIMGRIERSGNVGRVFDEEYDNHRVAHATLKAIASYTALEYRGRLLNVVASERVVVDSSLDTRRLWEFLSRGGFVAAAIPAPNSGRLFVSPHVESLATVLRDYLMQEALSCPTTFAIPK